MPTDWPGRRCEWYLILLALMASPALAQSTHLKVEISGVSGEVRANVQAMLSIARAAKDAGLTLDRIRRLHDHADAEIDLALQPFGYFRPVVSKSLKQDGKDWVARYIIDPGLPVVVRHVDLVLSGAGASAPEFRRAVASFPVHQGDPLHWLDYQNGKIALLTLAADSGYLNADFDTSLVRVDRVKRTADVDVRFDTGPRFAFGPVVFHQDVIDTSFLKTRIPFHRGEPFKLYKLLELQTSLGEDPYFSRVEVTPRRGSAEGGEVPIDVDLVARAPQSYEVGAGYGTDTGPRGRFAGTLRRLNRKGHFSEVEIIGSPIEQSISTKYSIPAFGHPTGALSFVAGYALINPATSSSRTWITGARLTRRRFGWREALSLTYQHEGFDVGIDHGVTNLFIGGVSYERTRANNRIFPSRGFRARFELQGARQHVLSAQSFSRLAASGKVVQGLGPRTRVLARVEAGHIYTGQFRQLPPTLRFFAGGDESVRGFAYQELGPRDSLNNVIGGSSLIVGSVEVEWRFLPRFAVAVFTDAGNAFNSFPLSIEQGVGPGLRWLSPIGLIRVDGAFAVSRPGAPFRLHVGIGPDL